MCTKALYSTNDTRVPLVQLATEGGNLIPLEGVVSFVSLLHTYQQKEVAEILTGKAIELTLASPVEEVWCSGKLLQLRVWVMSLIAAHKKCVCATTARGGRRGGRDSSNVRSKAKNVGGAGAADVETGAACDALCPRNSSHLSCEDDKQSELVVLT